jgi:hypothetical protein
MHMNMLPVKAGPSLDDKGAFQAIPSAEADPATYAAVACRGLPMTFGRLAGTAAPTESPRSQPSRKQTRRRSLVKRATSLLTPLELFYGIRPNYCILYKFGRAGYFRRTIESSGAKKSKLWEYPVLGI